MYKIEELQKLIVEEINNLQFKTEPLNLYEPIKYAMYQKGKRIRPLLSLISCQMFNGDVKASLIPAISLEMFHNFTLIHDDIMDKAKLRRGKETVYEKWDSNIAVLSGDALFALAYKRLMDYKNDNLIDLIHLLNETSIGVCEGQQMDLDFENRNNVSIHEYLEMIRLKTAILVGACLKSGAITANASIESQNLIFEYGTTVGLSFQLMDDLLDVFGEPKKFGKTIGGDIRENKKTFLYIKSLELAKGEDLQTLKHYFSKTDFDEKEKFDAIYNIYQKLNLKEITEEIMNKYYQEASDILIDIPVRAEKKNNLISLTKKIMQRDY